MVSVRISDLLQVIKHINWLYVYVLVYMYIQVNVHMAMKTVATISTVIIADVSM